MNTYKITIYDDREEAILPVSVFKNVKAVHHTDARLFGETLAKTLNIYKPSVHVEFVHGKKEKK